MRLSFFDERIIYKLIWSNFLVAKSGNFKPSIIYPRPIILTGVKFSSLILQDQNVYQ